MSNFTDSFLSANTANFPSEQLPSLRQRLSQLDDSQANQVIAAANIKSPTTALILSIFLGTLGVDRFLHWAHWIRSCKTSFGMVDFWYLDNCRLVPYH